MSPCKKLRNKGAELALKSLLTSDEEPDESAMVDLTVANEQYLERNVERSHSKPKTKQRVQEMKGVVKSLLGALERSESQEREIANQQAQQILQTLENMCTELRQESMTLVTDVELSDDVVNSTDLTESVQVANSEVRAVLEPPEVFKAEPPDDHKEASFGSD